jgi:hypothetical protein
MLGRSYILLFEEWLLLCCRCEVAQADFGHVKLMPVNMAMGEP